MYCIYLTVLASLLDTQSNAVFFTSELDGRCDMETTLKMKMKQALEMQMGVANNAWERGLHVRTAVPLRDIYTSTSASALTTPPLGTEDPPHNAHVEDASASIVSCSESHATRHR